MKKIMLFTVVLSVLALSFVGCDIINDIIGGDEHTHVGGEATCSSGPVCTECGEVYGEAIEHSFNDATCTTPAKCTVCGTTSGEADAHAWTEADCDTPKTCSVCGTTEGSAKGHTWTEADCDTPKTCSVCGATEGSAKGHTWTEADCDTPKTCSVCGATEGSAKGHTWTEADCDTPKTCSVCGTTESIPSGHTWVEADCDTPKTCSVCGATEGSAKGHTWTEADCDTPKTCSVCGTTEGSANGHNFGDTYEYDDNGHWLSCSVCGDKSNEGAHRGGAVTNTEKAKCEVCSAPYGDEPFNITWKTEAVSPLNGSTFTLANERIASWYKDYDFSTTDTDAHWLEQDIFYPECPVFEWSVGEKALYYKLYISTNADMTDAQCYLTSLTSLSVDYLYVDTVYYWFVDAVYGKYTVRSEVFSFTTDATPRTVNVEGVSNVRDLGGYITEDGKKIKQGMIYRSAKLDDITDLGEYTLLYMLGIKTDLDLRGYKEEAPIEELNYVPVDCPWYSTGSNHIWMNDYNKEEFAKAIKVFADINNYPIIFHCSLGRDRTGTLAMVLGGLLGLDENTLMMEYELSVFSYWGTNGSTKYNDGLRKSIHDTYLYISNNYEGDSFSEKVENFLLEIDVTAEEIASIRSIMLEEVE